MADGQQIKVTASYDEVIGNYGSEVTKRCIDKTFKLPKKLIGKVSLKFILEIVDKIIKLHFIDQ